MDVGRNPEKERQSRLICRAAGPNQDPGIEKITETDEKTKTKRKKTAHKTSESAWRAVVYRRKANKAGMERVGTPHKRKIKR